MDGDGILVHATIPVDADPGEDHDFVIVDLPDIEQAATILHCGAMDDVMPTIQALDRHERVPLGRLQTPTVHRARREQR
jgi:hypothetical protein